MSHTQDPAVFEQAKAAFFEGLAHLQAGRPAEAEHAFETALRLVPGRVSTLINLAATRVALDRSVDAIATADEVLAIEPGNADALQHRNAALGRLVEKADLMRDSGQLDEARVLYRQAQTLGADPELMAYCLAGLGDLGGAATPPSSPSSYVQALFDDYAADFDQHLVDVLRYRVPQGLAAPLAQLHPDPFRSALDLGCGTGLCGPLVRPLVHRLTGLDLSPRILDQARAKGVYDELHLGDILQHLAHTTEPHDLVLAADVFIYLGELEPVFAALKRVMPAGGVFCFSAETSGASEQAGFALQPSLRYAHHESYLRALADRHGFEPLRFSRETVREEQRVPIEGLLVHLRRG